MHVVNSNQRVCFSYVFGHLSYNNLGKIGLVQECRIVCISADQKWEIFSSENYIYLKIWIKIILFFFIIILFVWNIVAGIFYSKRMSKLISLWMPCENNSLHVNISIHSMKYKRNRRKQIRIAYSKNALIFYILQLIIIILFLSFGLSKNRQKKRPKFSYNYHIHGIDKINNSCIHMKSIQNGRSIAIP